MSNTEQTNRLGVNIMEQRVLEAGHFFREQSISDSGIDAQIEIKDGTSATGRLIAAQIKAGPSYFSREDERGFWHYVTDRHRNLWINYSLPMILVLCDLNNRVCYYEIVSDETCVRTGNSWKILIPKEKTICASSYPDLASIASPIVAASDFSIHAEQDESHGLARRVSLDIVVQLPIVRGRLDALFDLGDQDPYAASFTALTEDFENMWDGSFSAPAECQRLDQAIHELLATVGNAGLIWDQRVSRGQTQVRTLIDGFRDELDRLRGDISFLRQDVR